MIVISSLRYFIQISVLSDLPVGENLQDHVFVDHPIFETKDPIGVVIDKAKSIWSVLDYYIFGQGTFLMYAYSKSFVMKLYINKKAFKSKSNRPLAIRWNDMISNLPYVADDVFYVCW